MNSMLTLITEKLVHWIVVKDEPSTPTVKTVSNFIQITCHAWLQIEDDCLPSWFPGCKGRVRCSLEVIEPSGCPMKIKVSEINFFFFFFLSAGINNSCTIK